MSRLVKHRWCACPNRPHPRGDGAIPQVGQIIVGKVKAWRVVEVLPIESPTHANDFRGLLEPIQWQPGDPYDRYYLNAWERVGMPRPPDLEPASA